MTIVHPVVLDDLRVIMCLAFDRRAPAKDLVAFKSSLLKCEHVVSCCDLTGTFDFMLEATLPDLPAYYEKLEKIREPLSRLVARYEANFVCNRFVREPRTDLERALWVPTPHGFKRLDCSLIDRVSAEGDYMRVHSSGTSYLVHETLRDLAAKLGTNEFVHVHRSEILRCAAVDRLLHEGRRWDARLNDGSIVRIARSHVAEVMGKLRTHWANSKPNPPKSAQLTAARKPTQRLSRSKVLQT